MPKDAPHGADLATPLRMRLRGVGLATIHILTAGAITVLLVWAGDLM
jgi:hypothetical protein